MSRPLRLEFPGSLWHVLQRGNERRPTFIHDGDRVFFLELLCEAVERFKWLIRAYALMPNHFHLLLELTADATLSRGMQWLESQYAQWFNRTRDRVGHLFQGRFKSILVEEESYLLELSRYLVLNPVRAGIVQRVEDYPWTSYRATAGLADAPAWLAAGRVLDQFAPERNAARELYCQFVQDGVGSKRCPWDEIKGDMYLGSDDWLGRVRERVESLPRANEHANAQRYLLRPSMMDIVAAVCEALAVPEDRLRNGRGGIARALVAWLGCYEGMVGNSAIAATLRLRSDSRVSQLVAECDRELTTNALVRQCADRCLSTLRRRKLRTTDLTP